MRGTVPGLKLRWAESIYPPRERAAVRHGDMQLVMLLQVARQGLANITVTIGHENDGGASIANG